ncbi:hypothetical protein AcV7_005578 [Taiwanofungus camphoratus]|nr:hypothetical protein AcV7_005578 [Antrodia cinnamomea]
MGNTRAMQDFTMHTHLAYSTTSSASRLVCDYRSSSPQSLLAESPPSEPRHSVSISHIASSNPNLSGEVLKPFSIQDRPRSDQAPPNVELPNVQHEQVESREDSQADQQAFSSNSNLEVQNADKIHDAVKQIDQCCTDWSAGRLKPHWLIIKEPKFGRTLGCALRIDLSQRLSKVFSVDTVYDSGEDAKRACADVALAEGVLDFIKQWDSQTEPTLPSGERQPQDILGNIDTWSVQSFFETLPRPFPEPVEDKTAHEINGSAWLNTTIQTARGGKLVAKFIWTISELSGMHGCLLRLERPGECKSYLVDAKFSKRAEAKAAVCLQAMSQGVGSYIREIAKEVEAKVPAEMKRQVNEVLLPTLLSEYRKLRPGATPDFDFSVDTDACGCTLTIELSPSPTPDQVRKYTVPTEYRNRNDAKIVIVHLAVQEGVIDFIRFRGHPPPPGYVPFKASSITIMNTDHRKRKYGWEGGNWDGPHKRPRFNGTSEGNFPNGSAGRNFGKGYHRPFAGIRSSGRNIIHNGPWINSRVSGGAGSVAGSAYAGLAAGQFQPEPGNFGVSVTQNYSQTPVSSYGYMGGGGALQSGPYVYSHSAVSGGSGAAYYSPPAPPTSSGVASANPYQSIHTSSTGALHGAPNQVVGVPYSSYFPNTSPLSSAVPQYQQQPYQMGPANTAQHMYPGHGYQPGYQPYPPAATPASGYLSTVVHAQPAHSALNSTPAGVANSSVHPTGGSSATPSTTYSSTASSVTQNPPIAGPSHMANTTSPHANHGASAGNGHDSRCLASSFPPPSEPTIVAGQHRKGPIQRARGVAKSVGGKVASSGAGKVTIAVEPPPKSHVTALYDHCRTVGLPTPQFFHEIVKEEQGESKHKVSVIVGKQKFELPITFSSLSQGQERVAKKVLEQLRSDQAKAT